MPSGPSVRVDVPLIRMAILWAVETVMVDCDRVLRLDDSLVRVPLQAAVWEMYLLQIVSRLFDISASYTRHKYQTCDAL